MKRRPRIILKLCAFVAAGAIVNVAVAWGCERFASPSKSRGDFLVGFGVTISFERHTGYDANGVPVAFTTIYHEKTVGLPIRSVHLNPGASWKRWVDGMSDELPAYPLWPGFAINTVFYAAVLWVLFAFPFVLRRRIRARRGQCPACAYPIGTSDVCTECGTKLVTKARRHAGTPGVRS